MCLILFSLNQHPKYKFILAANRDEFYARQTAPAGYWSDHPHLLGGRDLEAIREDGTCGTWMAMTAHGKIAMITNYRDFENLKTKAPSRGHLVSDYLIQNLDSESYLKKVESFKNDYNGFNLIVGDFNNLFYLSNYREGVERLTPGFYGLSNHLLQTPWPKVVLAKSQLEPLFRKSEIDPEELLTVMQNESQASDSELPNTGIGIDRERALSAMFIKTEGYGTRCSTIVLVKTSGETVFMERTFNFYDFSFETKRFEFSLPPK